jgi:hypothetical protein
MVKSNMRVTSLLAFQSVLETIGTRQLQVLKTIREIEPCSNLEISKHLGLPINSCVPRCLELRKMGIVVMDRVDLCKYTGRRVTYWRIKKWLKENM